MRMLPLDKRDALVEALQRLCKDAGYCTDYTYDLLEMLADSVMEDDGEEGEDV